MSPPTKQSRPGQGAAGCCKQPATADITTTPWVSGVITDTLPQFPPCAHDYTYLPDIPSCRRLRDEIARQRVPLFLEQVRVRRLAERHFAEVA